MIIIGEKINASRADIRSTIQNRESGRLLELVRKQADAGANYIDLNVGTGIGSQADEIETMKWAVGAIQKQSGVPLCLDSADPAVLEAALEVRDGRESLINSVKAEDSSLLPILRLVSHYKAPVVALAMDEAGIPPTEEKRLEACEKIARAFQQHEIELDSLYFDPLVLPVSTDNRQGLVTLNTLAGIKKRYPQAKTTMGLSNVSYGLPARSRLNSAFLHMAIFAGLDSAIMDPLDEELMAAVRTGEALVGRDRHCRRYTRAMRRR